MSLGDFLARLHQNDGSDNHVTSAQQIRKAIISILQKQRLFGEVLLQLPRENDLQLPAMMGLRWEDNRYQRTDRIHNPPWKLRQKIRPCYPPYKKEIIKTKVCLKVHFIIP